MACTVCLVCLVSIVSGCHKNALGRGSASSEHIPNLEQSRFSLDIYDLTQVEPLELLLLEQVPDLT
jgi:hypothetical protein